MNVFEYYGHLAQKDIDFTTQNGRYSIQGVAQSYVPHDVAKKLNLNPSDHVLDIGCGLGTNLIPFSFMSEHVTGIDHPSVINRLETRFSKENITLLSGDFLETNFENKFDKIIIYSVLHCLDSQDDICDFICKALKTLKPTGILLLGDIPNADRKKRFLASERGKKFQKEWEVKMKSAIEMPQLPSQSQREQLVIDDHWMMETCLYIRERNFETQWVTQNSKLPFGNTREDIIVYGPEYNDILET